MANDETGKIGPADASKTPPPGADPAAEAQILEEHVVAPAQPAASAVPPPTPVPERARTVPTPPAPKGIPPTLPPKPAEPAAPPKSAIAQLLEKIKLPERREPAAAPKAPAREYDTSLNANAKTPEEQAAAHAEVLQTARSITESLETPVSQGDVRALHTLKDDLQYVVRDKKISLVRAVALEEEKRHHGTALEEHMEVQAKKEKRTRYGLFVAAILFFLGLLAIGAVLFIMAQRTQKTAAPITAQVLFSEQSAPLSVDNLAPADIRREIGNARANPLTLGAILQIVPVEQKVVNGANVTVPATFGEFLDKIGANAPPELARSLGDEFFFGLHTVDENAPIIVVPVTSYERAFAAMLEWEPTMNADLSPMFTAVSPQAIGPGGLPAARTFEDTVMRNYDVRALKDDAGQIQLYYSFPTRNILIIAESPYSFSEILSRLRADRKL